MHAHENYRIPGGQGSSTESPFGYYPAAHSAFSRPSYKKYATFDDLVEFNSRATSRNSQASTPDSNYESVNVTDRNDLRRKQIAKNTDFRNSAEQVKLSNHCLETKTTGFRTAISTDPQLMVSGHGIAASLSLPEMRSVPPSCPTWKLNNNKKKHMDMSTVATTDKKDLSMKPELHNLRVHGSGIVIKQPDLPKRLPFFVDCKPPPGLPQPPAVHFSAASVLFGRTIKSKMRNFDVSPQFISEQIVRSGVLLEGFKQRRYSLHNFAFVY